MICAKKLRIFFAVLALFPQVCECWKVDYGFSSSSILTLLLGATGSSSTADLAAMNSPRHSALGGSGGRSEEAIERLDLSSENLALGYHCCLPLLSLDPTGWTTLTPPPFSFTNYFPFVNYAFRSRGASPATSPAKRVSGRSRSAASLSVVRLPPHSIPPIEPDNYSKETQTGADLIAQQRDRMPVTLISP